MGLVSYASSDEEDVLEVSKGTSPVAPVAQQNATLEADVKLNGNKQPNATSTRPIATADRGADLQDAVEGPTVGPTIPDEPLTYDLPEDDDLISVPQSPYSANRALLRDLTLPTVPNYDIPQSPAGSPIESTNAKFKQFLKLKQRGVHFNEKLVHSAAMRNPSLMQKLLDFAEIDEEEQYKTSLSNSLWNPAAFPEYAFKEHLAKSQQKILKRKEEEKSNSQRENIDFVSASTSNNTSRNATPGLVSRGGTKSAAERIMAGLDQGRSSSPHVQGVKRKSRFDT